MLLYLVRHGETQFNLQGRIQGQGDSALTPLGIRQAESIANRLASHSFSAIYSSDLGRAMQTARIIASTLDMPIIASELLREAAFGVVQGLTREEIEERFPADLHEWRRNPRAMRPPGAETHEQIIERCGKFLAELAKSHSDNEPVLVVGHGGSLRGIIVAATGMPAAFFRMLHFSNAGLTIITTGDSPSIRHLNDVCHLASVEVTDVDADNAAP